MTFKKPINLLISSNVETKVSKVLTMIKNSSQGIQPLFKFRLNLSFSNFYRFIFYTMLCSFGLAFVTSGISLPQKFDQSTTLTKVNKNYTYSFDLVTPTEQSGLYKMQKYSNLGFTDVDNGIYPLYPGTIMHNGKQEKFYQTRGYDTPYKLEDLKSKRDTYEEQINLRNRTSKTVDMLREYLHKYRASIKMIKKFPIGPAADMSEAELTWNIISGFGLSIDLTPYREAKNLFEEVSAHRNDIAELEKLRASIAPNAQLKEQLEEDLRSLKEKYDKKNKEIKHLSAREQILDSDLIKMNEYKNTMEADLDKYQRFCSLTQTRDIAKEELAKYNDSWVKAKDIEMQIEVKKNRLDAIVSKEIADLQKQINDANAKLVMYNEYVKEYALCSKEFNKIGVIRKYCSPTTGIQTIFMEMYMNKVIGISNQLLSMLFNGEYVLQPFVVNENEFRMPVLGSGILNDDISSMSTSQICMISMILSFALMRQSSTIYNIIKIDELEGGLDSQNRLAFFDVLNNLMMTLQCEQCVMISHNAELNMKTMDVIVLKNSDPSSSYYEGNVIYDYNGRV